MNRQWLYNKDGGKLFEGDEAITKAIDNGYVDTPTKVINDENNITDKAETPVKKGKIK